MHATPTKSMSNSTLPVCLIQVPFPSGLDGNLLWCAQDGAQVLICATGRL